MLRCPQTLVGAGRSVETRALVGMASWSDATLGFQTEGNGVLAAYCIFEKQREESIMPGSLHSMVVPPSMVANVVVTTGVPEFRGLLSTYQTSEVGLASPAVIGSDTPWRFFTGHGASSLGLPRMRCSSGDSRLIWMLLPAPWVSRQWRCEAM